MRRFVVMVCCILLLVSLLPVSVNAASMPFTDVKSGSWYYGNVKWAWENGFVAGKTATTFCPDDDCTVGEFLTVLYRYAGSPDIDEEGLPSYEDVPERVFYYRPVMWAVSVGVVGNPPADGAVFGAKNYISRQLAMCYLYRYGWSCMGMAPYRDTISSSNLFTDVVQVFDWARTSVSWCVDNGLFAGTDGDKLLPRSVMDRAQLVTVFRRMCEIKPCIKTGHEWGEPFQRIEPTCIKSGYMVRTCFRCGCSVKYQRQAALGHQYYAVHLVSDATQSKPVKYRWKCTECGALGSQTYSLGYAQNGSAPARDTAKVSYPIKLSSGGASVEIQRKWFGGSWCYIAHMTLPKGKYSHWTGADMQTSGGASTTKTGLKAAKDLKALVLINGDANNGGIEADGFWARARNGKFYGRDLYRSWANYWNKNTGTYGSCGDLGKSIKTLVDEGLITDTAAFWSNKFVYQGRIKITSEANPDSRRQRTFMGFRTDGTTVHIYAVVADGWTGQGSTPYNTTFSNDGSSYGMTGFEEAVLLSSLGCDFGIPLDGGHSSVMVAKYNGAWYELNAASYKMPGYVQITSREIWDCWYFK